MKHYFREKLSERKNKTKQESGRTFVRSLFFAEVITHKSAEKVGIDITENMSYNSSVAKLNPFRYRGYYYDTETGLYYLNSRYYDPSIGRFINKE